MGRIVSIVMFVIWIAVILLLNQIAKKNNAARRGGSSAGTGRWHTERIPGANSGKRPSRSTDGHILTGVRDITCRQFGHNHPEWEEPSTRYIVHDDIEEGYIILNGKKMLRTEADQYENTI